MPDEQVGHPDFELANLGNPVLDLGGHEVEPPGAGGKLYFTLDPVHDRIMISGFRDQNHPGRFEPRRPKYPDHVGFCDHAILDDAGFIWLLDVLGRYERQEGEGYLYHVIDPEGRYLGMTRLPLEKPRISRGHVTGIEVDAVTGEQHLVVYDVVPLIGAIAYPE